MEKTQPKGIRIEGNKQMETLLFADDQMIMAENKDNLQPAVNNLKIIAQRYNMKIPMTKTKVIAFREKDPVRSKIVINGRAMVEVNAFKFLGTDISYLGEINVNRKITKFLKIARRLNHIVVDSNARRETRLKIYNTFAIPMLKYGCEVWTLKEKRQGTHSDDGDTIHEKISWIYSTG